jgi:preprotein translocase subunit SecG
VLTGILVVFHVIACFSLILVILLQVGRGHGLSSAAFSQGGVQTVFGTKAADFLSKLTTAMAIIFMLTCITLDFIQSRESRSLFAPAGGAGKVDLSKVQEALESLRVEEAKKAATGAIPATETETPSPEAVPAEQAPALSEQGPTGAGEGGSGTTSETPKPPQGG